ncbi:hypothetical protein [uncultured Tateyamaria sp.]|uniref:hypothetical protein n=1 Tax=uncultured Tateyamaria sp. TaxID=455651 RepID=UPI00262F01EF|nr:hypothetical protein [uncultured Tateyamaria sp.]
MADASAPLSRLNSNVHDLYQDIAYFATPLSDVHDALNELERIEKTPKRIKDKVGEIHNVLKNLERACKAGSWLPEVGTAAKTTAETLNGINTFLGEIETFLGEIQLAADDGAKTFLDIKDPIDKSWAGIAQVEGFLERTETVTSDLLAHYSGHDIPASVNACSERLGDPLEKIVKTLNDAKDEAQQKLNTAERAVEGVVSALKPAVSFSDFIEGIYTKLEPIRNAIHTLTDAVGRAAHYGETQIKAVLKLGARLGGKTYRTIKGLLDKFDGEIQKIKKKFIDWAFKPVRNAMKSVRDEIQKQVNQLPNLDPAKAAMEVVHGLLAQIDQAIDGLASECADLFSGKSRPWGSGATAAP